MQVKYRGKVIGTMVGGKLIKRGPQVILFRKYDGYGVSEEILKKFRPTHIQLQKDEHAYQVTIDKFRRHAVKHINDKDSSDVQWILPREYWDYKNLNQQKLEV